MTSLRSHATTDQLRAEIDRGATGSKVPASDPATAPLGTDEEAAGVPPSGGAVDEAIRAETSGATSPPPRQRGLGAAWILAGIILVLGIAMLAATLL